MKKAFNLLDKLLITPGPGKGLMTGISGSRILRLTKQHLPTPRLRETRSCCSSKFRDDEFLFNIYNILSVIPGSIFLQNLLLNRKIRDPGSRKQFEQENLFTRTGSRILRLTYPVLCIGILGLSGCTQYAETFDCGAGIGVGCRSLNDVNRMVEAGHLPRGDDGEADFISIKDSISHHKSTKQRVWMTGHRDAQGHYHEPSYIQMRLRHDR